MSFGSCDFAITFTYKDLLSIIKYLLFPAIKTDAIKKLLGHY